MAANSSSFRDMNDRVIAESLKAGDPDALAVCYDQCAGDLYQYCWFMLRDREAARVAVRDALVAAQAHIGRLKDPDLVWPWLYAMARAERRRLRPAPPDHPDVTVAKRGEPGADLRLTGWNAVMNLPAAQREGLYLSVRRGLAASRVGLVLGVPERDAEALLERGRRALEQGVIGEVLGRGSGAECEERVAILFERGATPATVREGLARHAAGCKACARRVPHRVSAAKAFGVLPAPEPPAGMRLRTMTFLTDPELAGYRALVARRAARFDASGFPVQDRRGRPGAGGGTARVGLWAGLISAAAAMMAAAVFALGSMGRFDAGATPAQQDVPAVPVPGAGQQAPDASSGLVPGGRPISPISPLGAVLPPLKRGARPGSQLLVFGGLSLPAAGGVPGQGGQSGRQPGGKPPSAPAGGSQPPGQPHPSPPGPPPSPSPSPSPSPTRTSSPSGPGAPRASAAPSPQPAGTGPAPSPSPATAAPGAARTA